MHRMEASAHVFYEHDRIALRYLRYLALHGGGYERRGVRGWALRDDVEDAAGVWIPERLPYWHGYGLLDREDVRVPTHRRPVWIWRISQEGARVIAELEHLPHRRVPPLSASVGDAAVHIPGYSLAALRELRRALEMRVVSPLLPGEPGWRTLPELKAQATGEEEEAGTDVWEPRRTRDPLDGGEGGEEPKREPWKSGDWVDELAEEARGWDPLQGDTPDRWALPPFGAEDLGWLVRAGLAQRWSVKPAGKRVVALYRVTPLGGVVVPLEWREPG